MLASFDHMLLKPWLKSRKALSGRDVGLTRWFFVHSFANLFVCAMAFNSMRAVLTDPFYALDASHHPNTSPFGAGTQWPLTIINSVHVYHMIGGFRLGPADYFHHCLFIPTISFPGQYYKWGPLANFQAFFISGMPGGIDYFLLGLLKLGLISPLFEKRVNSNLNVWLRVPGILLSTMLMYQARYKHAVGQGHCQTFSPSRLAHAARSLRASHVLGLTARVRLVCAAGCALWAAPGATVGLYTPDGACALCAACRTESSLAIRHHIPYVGHEASALALLTPFVSR